MSNLEYLREKRRSTSADLKDIRRMDDYLIGILSSTVSPKIWKYAVDAAAQITADRGARK